MKKILLVDHYDSFTFNLYQLLESLGSKVEICAWDKIEDLRFKIEDSVDGVVLSPGPGKPEDYEASRNLVQKNYTDIPVLGVCLGMQIIGWNGRNECDGCNVIHAPEVMHGKTSEIFHDNEGLFKGIKNPFRAARYHSLVLESVPEDFEKSAWTEDGIIMGIRHKEYPLFGVQFHPESFLTEGGGKIMSNFVKLIGNAN